MGLRLIPDDITLDFFKPLRFWLAVSLLGVVATIIILPIRGLNYGVDFLGGTLIGLPVALCVGYGYFADFLAGAHAMDEHFRTAPLEHPYGRGMNLQIEIPDVDTLHARVLASDLGIVIPLEERWYRTSRRARRVTERIFYGDG